MKVIKEWFAKELYLHYKRLDHDNLYSQFFILFGPVNMVARISLIPVIFYWVVVLWI